MGSISNVCGMRSPFEELAVTSIAATRDVSMKAQVKQAYTNLDSQMKAKVDKAIDTVQVKAETPWAGSPLPAFTDVNLSPKVEKDELVGGITAPTGFFDPLGFATNCQGGTLLYLREAELKHGRVGMLASLGFIVGEKFHPFYGGEVLPANLIVTQTGFEKFWFGLLIAVTTVELSTIGVTKTYSDDPDARNPGDFGFDPLGMKPKAEKDLMAMTNKELNNGRLAMLAAAGIIAQEWATGKTVFG